MLETMTYHSHIGQDAWVAESLSFKKNGFFLDFGAFDGRTISNTLALEEDLNWRGICVEPNPRYFSQLCEYRRSVCINCALWPVSREQLRFIDVHGLSSLEAFRDCDSNADLRRNADCAIIEVDTLNPSELLARFNAPIQIDYLSLDVEGAELEVLAAIDLSLYRIALMTIEHNHNTLKQKAIRTHLAQFGYEVRQHRNDDFFFHREHLANALEPDSTPLAPEAILEHIDATFEIR